MQTPPKEQEVRLYYDRNMYPFLRFARNSAPKAIHQPLYEHPHMSLEDALHTHHRKILHTLPKEINGRSILDLGCGVGESMMYLAQHTPSDFKFYGITLSAAQALAASARILKAGLSDRIQVIKGSFQSLPPTIQNVEVAYAIESFIHSPDPSEFFVQVNSALNQGGRLILFDDFLTREPENQTERNILTDLKSGWLANTLLTVEQTTCLALQTGFLRESSDDLSGLLRLQRLRDKCIHLLAPLARLLLHHSQYCRFLVGGDARQQAYHEGLLQYAMLVFTKT